MAAERDFRGKTVVVTRAGGGLGAASVRRFARAGAQLGLLDLDAARVPAFAAELAAQGALVRRTFVAVTRLLRCHFQRGSIGSL
jgi:NAD(P)-dependent dehydrogenase (short-subunit alcohol dehydrogenase family)